LWKRRMKSGETLIFYSGNTRFGEFRIERRMDRK
jgi:hypothetical protein